MKDEYFPKYYFVRDRLYEIEIFTLLVALGMDRIGWVSIRIKIGIQTVGYQVSVRILYNATKKGLNKRTSLMSRWKKTTICRQFNHTKYQLLV